MLPAAGLHRTHDRFFSHQWLRNTGGYGVGGHASGSPAGGGIGGPSVHVPGNTAGTIGETSALALLLGGIFLVLMGVIDLRIPLTYLGSFLVFMLLFGGHGADGSYLLGQLFGGGLMLGAWFMATDYVTSPITPTGRVVYGVILGIMTGIFRVFGSSAEGVSTRLFSATC